MIGFTRDPDKAARIADMPLLIQTIDLFMGHHHKIFKATARSSRGRLVRMDWPSLFFACGIDPTWRPERLSPDQYISLANALSFVLRGS